SLEHGKADQDNGDSYRENSNLSPQPFTLEALQAALMQPTTTDACWRHQAGWCVTLERASPTLGELRGAATNASGLPALGRLLRWAIRIRPSLSVCWPDNPASTRSRDSMSPSMPARSRASSARCHVRRALKGSLVAWTGCRSWSCGAATPPSEMP